MLVEKLNMDVWQKLIVLKELPVYYETNYLEAIAIAFHIHVVYLAVYDKGNPRLLLAAFEKNNKLITPEYFTYNPYWIDKQLGERKQLEIQKSLIFFLKKHYKKIVLKFNTNIGDIRPFKWEGFRIDIRYTYIKDTSEPVHTSIIKNLNRVKNAHISIIPTIPDESVIDLNVSFLSTFGIRSTKIICYKTVLQRWAELGYLKSFTIKNSDQIIGSSLVLLDKKLKTAYTYISSPISRNEKYAHTMLYQYRLDWLAVNGFTVIDFCGANMEKIAVFKTYFNPILKPYYIVKYSRWRNRLKFVQKIMDAL